ncbi:hypothetical protein HN859_03465 [Candidatus Parcubacteria bacterium]|mgnify:CR=1 FL=1|nr:hypothetical protein [Candidatus Parcubacteria bacterium]
MAIPQMCIDEGQKATVERRRFEKLRKAKLATSLGKTKALAALATRKSESETREQVNNGRLYAGSSMYFYCSCGDVSDIKGEGFTDPPNHTCRQCKALKDKGWL